MLVRIWGDCSSPELAGGSGRWPLAILADHLLRSLASSCSHMVFVYSWAFMQESGRAHPLSHMSALAVLFVIAKTQKLSEMSINR